jgi:hypothetical protein
MDESYRGGSYEEEEMGELIRQQARAAISERFSP